MSLYTVAHLKSSHHELRLHRPTSSTANFPRLSFTANCLLWSELIPKSKSKLLYDWRFAANQFVLAVKPLETHDHTFFQLNSCGDCPFVTSSLTRRWECLLWLNWYQLQSVVIYTPHGLNIKHSLYCSRSLSTEPFPSSRSLQLRRGQHRKHFYCIVDSPCMLDCLQSCCLATS
jgi:hypothetical protein